MFGLKNFVRVGVGLAIAVGLFVFLITRMNGGHAGHHHVDAAASHIMDMPVIPSPVALTTTSPRVVVNVNVSNFQFSPADVEIPAGSTVHWIWGAGSGTHSATSGTCSGAICTQDGVFNSGTKASGVYDFVFNTPGTYPYYCMVHGEAMTGSVTVTPATAAGVTVSGRVIGPGGRGILQATVTMTDEGGVQRHAVTDRRGIYSFEDVEPGRTYVMSAVQRRYQFDTRIESVTDNVGNIDFVASGDTGPRRSPSRSLQTRDN